MRVDQRAKVRERGPKAPTWGDCAAGRAARMLAGGSRWRIVRRLVKCVMSEVK